MADENNKTPININQETPSKEKDIKNLDFSTLNVDQLNDLKKNFLTIDQLASVDDAIKNKGDGKKIGVVKEDEHKKGRKKGKKDYPKAEDVIDAMFNNIVIPYTYDAFHWMGEQIKRGGDYLERSKNDYFKNKKDEGNARISDNTFKFNYSVLEYSTELMTKVADVCSKFNGWDEVGKLIREGRIDEVNPNYLSDDAKNYIRGLSDSERNEQFSEENMKKGQEAIKNHVVIAQDFAHKVAAAQICAWKIENKDHPKLQNKSMKELYEKQRKDALAMYKRHMSSTFALHTNNPSILKRSMKKEADTLTTLADKAFVEVQTATNAGEYRERINKLRGIKNLETIKEHMQETHKKVIENNVVVKTNLFHASIEDVKFDNLAEILKNQESEQIMSIDKSRLENVQRKNKFKNWAREKWKKREEPNKDNRNVFLKKREYKDR